MPFAILKRKDRGCMAVFTLKKIQQEATNRQTYLRGVSCYNSGRVSDVTRESNTFYAEYITAQVQGSDPSVHYHVEVGFDDAGEADYYECTCPAFEQYEGACKHIIALMVHKYYADMVSGMTTAAQLMKKAAPRKPRTDDAARRMMEAYVAQETAQFMAQALPAEEQVTLVPCLSLTVRPSVTFTLGSKRQYVLRDIDKFFDAMQEHATVEYGKQLRFLHHLDAFAPASRPLVQFLLRCVVEHQYLAGGYYTYARALGRELPLSPAQLDAFFELFSGQKVARAVSARVETLRFAAENPAITLEVQPEKNGFRFSAPAMRRYYGARYTYIDMEGTLYRCEETFLRQVGELVHGLEDGYGSLFITEEDMPEFCTGVLPAIRGCVSLTGSTEQLEQFAPLPMEPEVYLDAPDSNRITARLLCCYGEKRLNPYQEAAHADGSRDRVGELKLRLLLQKYFPLYDEDGERLVLEGDDETIYRFITDGVDEISAAAPVYVTDRFKKIGIDPAPRVAVGVSLDSDLLELSFDFGELERDELLHLLEGYREHKKFHRLKSGRYIQLDESALTGLSQIVDGLALTEMELRTGRVSVPKYRAMYLDKVMRANEGLPFSRDNGFKSLVKNMKAVEDSEFAVPPSLAGVLRNYQKTGFRWLKTMEQYGFGGILADDMGLGKTLQVITLLLDARQNGNTLPSLVVCPTSLVFNWESELHRFAPELTVLVITGDAAARAELLRLANAYDVVITSYDMLKRDIEHYAGKKFRYHVLDEAQYIKNHNTQNAKAVKAVVSRQRFALTGTPIENRLSELWSIFDFLMPGFLFGYTKFRDKLETPIVKNGDEDALEQLSRMSAPFILRRLKKDVLRELPAKTETVLYTTMETPQRQTYLANLAQARQQLRTEDAAGSENGKLAILAVLTRLRQICCDPSLCYENYEGGSAKLECCIELLKEAAATGHKVLLFSQFTSMLAILRDRLEAEGLRYYLLQGSTSKEQRAAMVDSFNRDDTEVFLISLKAGGTGLNLTGADVVIHFDPWWNLSAQNQATDRAHRIGQKNSVQVYKLIAKDTIEEKILRLQETKQDLAEAVIRQGEGLLSALTREQLLELLE